MAACMAAPAGRPAVIPSHRMEDYCARYFHTGIIIRIKKSIRLAYMSMPPSFFKSFDDVFFKSFDDEFFKSFCLM
jgi:hypothetical protein